MRCSLSPFLFPNRHSVRYDFKILNRFDIMILVRRRFRSATINFIDIGGGSGGLGQISSDSLRKNPLRLLLLLFCHREIEQLYDYKTLYFFCSDIVKFFSFFRNLFYVKKFSRKFMCSTLFVILKFTFV